MTPSPFGPLAAVAVAMSRRVKEQRLYEVTIPGLVMDSEFADVRRCLLAEFPRVIEVWAMRMPETLLIVYRGEDEIDAWCAALSRAVALRRRALLGEAEPSPAAHALPAVARAVPAVGAHGCS